MRVTDRARRAGLAVAMAAVIGGGGIAACAAAGAPAASPQTAAAAPHSVPASAAGGAAASYAPAVRKVLPSVVLIHTTGGLGSGVVLDRHGNIVTNAHVAGAAKSFQVQLAGDTVPRSARLVGTYPRGDLAVIRVANPTGLTPARFGDSSRAQVGDVVLAVGNPLGLSGSVTEGIISATGRAVAEPATATAPATALPDTIQTSAPINPGNSGGALVTTTGEVIGIPTLAAASPQGGTQAQGIGFAIPANTARDLAVQIIRSGHVTNSHRAALGAEVTTVARADGAATGVGIVAVSAGGPGDRAGLRAGDVIAKLGGTLTPDTTTLAEALAAADPRQAVTATITRGTQTLTVKIILGELQGG